MGLAQPKISNKKRQAAWQAKKHTEKMLDMSIANAPSLAFGVKMMEKMGWQQGQGLGANKQGMIEPIKTKQTVNNKGLGFTSEKGVEQVHYALHFERYESVLASLKPINNTNSSDDEQETNVKAPAVATKKLLVQPVAAVARNKPKDGSDGVTTSSTGSSCSSESSSSSDEETKKPNRNRNLRRFWKATRAKDVSKYSKNDLDCIIGAKSHALYNDNPAGNTNTNLVYGQQNSKDYFNNLQSASNCPSDDSDAEPGSTFTPTFQLSSHSASAARNTAHDQDCRPCFGGASQLTTEGYCPTSSGGSKPEELDDESESRPCFGSSFNYDGASAGGELSNTRDDDSVEKHFMARIAMNYTNAFVKAEEGIGGTLFHFENYDDTGRKMDVDPSEGIDQLETENMQAVETKLKNRKRKKTGALSLQEEVIESCVLEPLKKKKKKKKHCETEAGRSAEEQVGHEVSVDNDNKVLSVKKKKRKLEIVKNVVVSDSETELVNDEVKTKTKKEKRKRSKLSASSCLVVEAVGKILNEGIVTKNAPEDSEEPLRKKSKKHKEKDCRCPVKAASGEALTATGTSEQDGLADLTRKEKKKKRRREEKDVAVKVASTDCSNATPVVRVKKGKKCSVDDVAANLVAEVSSDNETAAHKKNKKKRFCKNTDMNIL